MPEGPGGFSGGPRLARMAFVACSGLVPATATPVPLLVDQGAAPWRRQRELRENRRGAGAGRALDLGGGGQTFSGGSSGRWGVSPRGMAFPSGTLPWISAGASRPPQNDAPRHIGLPGDRTRGNRAFPADLTSQDAERAPFPPATQTRQVRARMRRGGAAHAARGTRARGSEASWARRAQPCRRRSGGGRERCRTFSNSLEGEATEHAGRRGGGDRPGPWGWRKQWTRGPRRLGPYLQLGRDPIPAC